MSDRQSGFRQLWCGMATVLLLAVSAPGMAAPCTESGSRSPIDITVPEITVGRDVPVGAVLAEVSSPQSSYRVNCSGPNNTLNASLGALLKGNVMEVRGLDGQPIPGLGVRLKPSSSLIRSGNGRCSGANVTLTAGNQFGWRA